MKRYVFGYLLFTVLVTVAILYPFSALVNDHLPDSVDPLLYAWNLSHNIQSATHGFKDLMDTNIFYPEGNTLAFSDTLFAQTVLTAPILLITKNPVLAENLYVLSTFPIAALTMFFLSYSLTGNVIASFLSGLFFAFSYPRLSQIGHMPALSSQWLPLVFLYLVKYIREGKFRNLLLTFLWYLFTITSTLYFGVFLIPLGAFVAIVEVVGLPKKALLTKIRDLCILAIPAAIILAIVLFPYIRLSAEYRGIKRSVADSARYAALTTDYLSVLPTSWLADIGFRPQTNERPLYPTVTLSVLAISSVLAAARRHRKTALTFLALAIVAGLLSLGPGLDSTHLPYYYVYKIFPLLQSVRVPARFSIFVLLGLSVSAACTLSRIFEIRRRAPLAILISLLFLTEVWQMSTPTIKVPLWKDIAPVYHFLDKKPDSAIIVELPLHPEWLSVPMEKQLSLTFSEVNENDVYALEAYRTYFSAFHRKRMLNGYTGYFPNIYHDHTIILDNFPTPEALTMLEKQHVTYILIHADEYVNQPYSDIARKIREYPQLKLVGQFGTDYVYTL